jgi:hypothetical protein
MDSGNKEYLFHRAQTLIIGYGVYVNYSTCRDIVTILQPKDSGTLFLFQGGGLVVLPLIIRSIILERAARDDSVPLM